ncbi:carbamoyl-phosphate synthase large subunit [Weissella kandleri]|uniref:ATP-binding protein n=1 Tax=Weissella kandleri TaxID=1616 RepID=UPI00387E7C38
MVERILMIGGSANDFDHETESDLASYQMVSALRQNEAEIFMVDDNPYAFTIERTDITPIFCALTLDNLLAIIEQNQITAVVTTAGGLVSMNLGRQLQKTLGTAAPKILGLSRDALEAAQDTTILRNHLNRLGEKTVAARLANNVSEAFEVVREINFPVVVRPIAPNGGLLRFNVNDAERLEEAVEKGLERSQIHQVNIDQSIRGHHEITIVALRDRVGNTLIVGGIEDMDPVGIHTADSIAFTPIQSLSDPIIQKLRQTTIKILHEFQIMGMAQVRFAVNPETDEYVVTRLTPYFDRQSSLIMVATGYPLVPVVTNLILGKTFEQIHLPAKFSSNSALLEPVMDHVVTRFPVFNFGEFEANWIVTDHRLNTVQKSVGATIGVGRSVEEAIEKALRAAHFNSRDFSPTIMNSLTEDDLIERIIHPRNNRILVLMEALRRGYTVDELAEMTKIAPFYFYKLKRIMELEDSVAKNPWDETILREAKYYGLSDGLLARLWNEPYEKVRRFRWDHNILPTYKAFDPSAGEFDEENSHYYSTFESENETKQLDIESALVVGTGAFRLGDGAAASYTMASVASELRRLGIPTIVVNNNPHGLLFIPQSADKHYYEPLELSDVMNILEIEHPKYIFIPGNRIKLIRKLREMNIPVYVIAKEKYLPSTLYEAHEKIVIDYFWDGQKTYPLAMEKQDNDEMVIDQRAMTPSLYAALPRPKLAVTRAGLYQLMVDHWPIEGEVTADDLRPMPFTHMAFLAKITGVNWLRMMVRYMTGRQSEADTHLVEHWVDYQWSTEAGRLVYTHPDFMTHLNVHEHQIDNGRLAMGAHIEPLEQEVDSAENYTS